MIGVTLGVDGPFSGAWGWAARIGCLVAALLIFHPSLSLSYLGMALLVFIILAAYLQYRRVEKEIPHKRVVEA